MMATKLFQFQKKCTWKLISGAEVCISLAKTILQILLILAMGKLFI